jgi:adenine-specific DNA-methyltransferase
VPDGSTHLQLDFASVTKLPTLVDKPPNLLIQGDNRIALSRLLPKYRRAVRCAYLDPPYNNGERYTHYLDVTEREAWLVRVGEQLEGVLPLLHPDNQLHYLKVLADQVFGRERFMATIVWQHRKTRENRRAFSNNHEYVLVYAMDPARFRQTRNRIAAASLAGRYKNPDGDPRGPWQSISANVQAGHGTGAQFYELVAPNGRRHVPPKGRCWVYTRGRMEAAIAKGDIWFGRDGNGVPRIKRFLRDARLELTPETLWDSLFAGTTHDATKHLLELFPSEAVFETPKPELLLRRIIEIATDPGDLVLDPFLGSGTTAAVAHKLGRRYIGIEVGPHAVTHCVERLRKVVAGEAGGISEEVGWTGGGSFSFVHVDAADAAAA